LPRLHPSGQANVDDARLEVTGEKNAQGSENLPRDARKVLCPPWCNRAHGAQSRTGVMRDFASREESSRVVPCDRGAAKVPSMPAGQVGVRASNPQDQSFNGIWNKAWIHDGVLSWNEGEDVALTVTSTKTFQMRYLGTDYAAELRDGKLHWDDDDVWTRQSSDVSVNWHHASFKGTWNKACIHDGVLTWNDGEDVAITVTSAKSFQMQYLGKDYTAELWSDGKLHWDDDDVWTRMACEAPPHKLEQSQQGPGQVKHSQRFRETRCSCESSVARQNLSKQADAAPAKVGEQDSCGKRVVVSMPVDERRYQGVVSWFRGSYGWLQCAEVAARYPGCVIFLHSNDTDAKPKQGDKMSFQVSEDVPPDHRNKQVKAVHARKLRVEERINAREYMGKTFTEKRHMLRGL